MEQKHLLYTSNSFSVFFFLFFFSLIFLASKILTINYPPFILNTQSCIFISNSFSLLSLKADQKKCPIISPVTKTFSTFPAVSGLPWCPWKIYPANKSGISKFTNDFELLRIWQKWMSYLTVVDLHRNIHRQNHRSPNHSLIQLISQSQVRSTLAKVNFYKPASQQAVNGKWRT